VFHTLIRRENNISKIQELFSGLDYVSLKPLINKRSKKGQTAFELLLDQLRYEDSGSFKTKCEQILNFMDFITPFFEAYSLYSLESYAKSFELLLGQSKHDILIGDYVRLYNTFLDKITRWQGRLFALTCLIRPMSSLCRWELREFLNSSFIRMNLETLDAREFLQEDNVDLEVLFENENDIEAMVLDDNDNV